MTFFRAKEIFQDAHHYVDAHTDPAGHDLYAGLVVLTEAIQHEFDELHREIAHVSQQIHQLQGQ